MGIEVFSIEVGGLFAIEFDNLFVEYGIGEFCKVVIF